MIRTDIVRTYRKIHGWVGIVCGLFLFIAFYAGAITMFEEPVQRWAATPPALPAPPPLDESGLLIDAVLAQQPESARNWRLHFETGPEAPARISWPAEILDDDDHAATPAIFGAALDENGVLVVERVDSAPVAQFIDVLHQQVGLPFPHEWAMAVTGAVGLLYFLALVSGVITILPSLVADLLQFRVGKNLKRMWLDVHNALGIFSLPFHLVMALTTIVFALHDPFYAVQNQVIYDGDIRAQWAQARPPAGKAAECTDLLAPDQLHQRIRQQAPGFTPTIAEYRSAPDGSRVLRVQGYDARYQMRGPTFGIAGADPCTGELIQTEYLPGHQSGWAAVITSFFALHFGSFGGDAVRWGYFILGMAGALMFYAGNLVWIESHRKRARRELPDPQQDRSSYFLGSLSIGVTLGCVAGISTTLAAAPWLPGLVTDAAAWHRYLYYAVFLGGTGWAFLAGPARAALHLLWFAALATATLAITAFVTAGGTAGSGWTIGAVALSGATGLACAAIRTGRRIHTGPPDSIWSLQTTK